MKNKVIPTRITPGASYEQVKIEQEMNELIVKSNRWSFLLMFLVISILGIPIAIILYLVKGKKIRGYNKRLNILGKELDDLILKEALEKETK